MKINLSLIIAVICAIVISLDCVAEENSNLKIGWIGPLTGNAAILGVDALEATQMAIEEVNSNSAASRKVKLVVEDDQYITKNTISSYQKLTQDGIKVIYVYTYGGLFAIAERALRDGVLLIDPLDCDERIAKLPENVICVSAMTEHIGQIAADHATAQGLKSVGIIYYENDPFMGVAAEATIKRLADLGGKVKYAAGYLGNEANFRAILLNAKKKKVDALFFYGYDELGLAMKQAKGLGLNVPFYALNTISSPGFYGVAEQAAEGTQVASWIAPRNEKFAKFLAKFTARVGRNPNFEVSSIPAYDTAAIIAQALIEGTNVSQKLYSLKNYPGVSGLITVDPDGAARSLVSKMYQFSEGKLIPIEE